ncbi:MAG: hypothetical protein AAFO95_21900 [Cyanobacteria bacterium J06600_6]
MSQSSRYRIMQIAIAFATLIITIHAVSVMISASLGFTADSDRWSYILTLQTVLAIIGLTGYLSNSVNFLPTIVTKFSRFSLITFCGVLLGFYYGGTYTNNNSQAAIVTAIAMGIIFNLVNHYQRQTVSKIVILIAGICAYGFALMRGIAAINLIAGSWLIPGIIWGCVCLIYLGLTVSNLAIAFKKIRAI